MEIKTCEQYVLKLLEDAYNRIKELEEENESLKFEIQALQMVNEMTSSDELRPMDYA